MFSRGRWLAGLALCAALLCAALLFLDRPGDSEPSTEKSGLDPAGTMGRRSAGGAPAPGTARASGRRSRHGRTIASRLEGRRQSRGERGPAEAPTAAAPAAVVRVLDAADGQPVADASLRVMLRSDRQNSARSVRTDGEGRFVLSGVEPGLHAMQLHHPRFLSHTQALELPETAADPILVEVRLHPGHSLIGQVVDRSGEAVDGARVILARWGEEGLGRARALTDAAGAFRLDNLRGGAWTLTISKVGFRAAGPLEVDVPGTESLELLLAKDRALVVRAMANGVPLEGALVRARVAGLPAATLPLRPARSTSAGEAALRGLPSEGAVEVSLTGSHPEYSPVSLRASIAELSRGDAVLEFRAPGRVGGVVVGDGDRPVANARVRLSGPVEKTLHSTSTGQFVFGELPAGTYSLAADTPREGSSRSAPLEVSGPEEIRKRLVLERGPGVIGGRALDGEGEPRPLAPVLLEGPDLSFRSISDREGYFRFEGLPAGRYRLTAGSRRRGIAVREAVATGTDDLVVRLESPGSISGVVDMRGPSECFAIRLERSGPSGDDAEPVRTYRFSSNEPYFKLEDVSPGSYRLVLLRQGRAEAELEAVQVQAGTRTGPLVLGVKN